MRHCSKIIFYLGLPLLLLSCGRSVAHTTTTLSPIQTSTSTSKLIPISEVTPTITTLPSPSVLPTINPTEIPNLLQSAYSIETLDIVNGHNLRRVSGWDYGYNSSSKNAANAEPYYTHRYQWMDSRHLLLFPITGVIRYPNWTTEQKQAVVFNLDTGIAWLPREQLKEGIRVLDIPLPRWSPEAEVLISSEISGVFTLTADGDFVAAYNGKLHGISPSGNKILVDDTWIDLKNKKMVDFAWHFKFDEQTWLPIWSSDENRVFMCCHFYGNAETGESYYLPNEDTIFEGKQPTGFDKTILHSHGVWLNNNYVLAEADGFYTALPGFEDVILIFDVSSKTYRSLIKVANLPYDLTDITTRYATKDISPNGDYMWIHKVYYPTGFLIDLKTLRTWEYTGEHMYWSRNGEYAIIGSNLLALSSKELKAMPSDMQCNNWHPTKGVCLSLVTNEQGSSILIFLNVQDMSVQKADLTASRFNQAIWSPNGDYIILATEDKALWKVDYPSLENMEQLTRPIADMYVESIIWSHDYEYLSFVGSANIYIVDINKSQ